MATCYHCHDGRHADCVGVPCECPCLPTDKAPCAICRQQGNPTPFGHWAWHAVCRNELNPVALIGFIDRLPRTTAVTQIREYVIAVTGMDVDAAKAKISEQGW